MTPGMLILWLVAECFSRWVVPSNESEPIPNKHETVVATGLSAMLAITGMAWGIIK